MNIQWSSIPFDNLSINELHEIYQLRQQVFIVEQHCHYLDADDHDKQAWHICGRCEEDNKLVLYARVLPPKEKYPEPSIGRVLCEKSARKQGLGRELISECLKQITTHYPNQGVRISAQLYLEKLYAAFGFELVGEMFMEANVPHIEMFCSEIKI